MSIRRFGPLWFLSPTSQRSPVIHQLVPNDEDLTEIMMLTDPRLTIHELTLPTLVYKLLTEGAARVIREMVP